MRVAFKYGQFTSRVIREIWFENADIPSGAAAKRSQYATEKPKKFNQNIF